MIAIQGNLEESTWELFCSLIAMMTITKSSPAIMQNRVTISNSQHVLPHLNIASMLPTYQPNVYPHATIVLFIEKGPV